MTTKLTCAAAVCALLLAVFAPAPARSAETPELIILAPFNDSETRDFTATTGYGNMRYFIVLYLNTYSTGAAQITVTLKASPKLKDSDGEMQTMLTGMIGMNTPFLQYEHISYSTQYSNSIAVTQEVTTKAGLGIIGACAPSAHDIANNILLSAHFAIQEE